MQLSVIIVNYNVRAFLQQALESLEKSIVELDAEIIVVDNHSVDGSVDMLKENFPDVRLIANAENVGFAKANNQALDIASGEYVWLLNPDTLVQEDTAPNLIKVMQQNADIGLLGCKILNDDGSLQLACRRSFPTPWVAFTKLTGLARLFPKSRLFGKYNLTYLDEDQEAEVEAISGSCMFARKQALEEVGKLDETFFMYGEDLDWCYRYREAGWKVVYTPMTSIVHYKGESAKQSTLGSLTTFYKAMDIFARKHFGSSRSFPLHWMLRGGIFFRYSLSLLSSLGKNMSSRLMDIGGLLLITLLAIFLKFGTFSVLDAYQIVLPIYLAIWYAVLVSMGLYRTFRYSVSRALLGVTLGFLINVTLTFFFREYAFSRMVMLFSYVGALIWVPAWRIVAARRRSENYAVANQRVIIIGDLPTASNIYSKLLTDVNLGYDPVGIVTIQGHVLESDKVIGNLDDLLEIVQVHRADQVIFASDDLSLQHIFKMLPELNAQGIKIKLVPGNLAFIIGKSSVENLQEVKLIDMDYQFFHPVNRLVKRLMDLILSIGMLILLRPFQAFLASVQGIKAYDFVRGDNSIRAYDSSGRWNQFWERLPSLRYVLMGRMSLVGAPLEMQDRPSGIPVGLMSLEELRTNKQVSAEERLSLLNYYIHNQSILLDLEIIIKTMMGK